MTLRPAVLDADVAVLRIALLAQALRERGKLSFVAVSRETAEDPDHRHPPLLRPRHQRPCRGRGRGAEEGEEGAAVHCVASTHSITSSARTRISGGMFRPSALAVF